MLLLRMRAPVVRILRRIAGVIEVGPRNGCCSESSCENRAKECIEVIERTKGIRALAVLLCCATGATCGCMPYCSDDSMQHCQLIGSSMLLT
jgi:hypothetical protein